MIQSIKRLTTAPLMTHLLGVGGGGSIELLYPPSPLFPHAMWEYVPSHRNTHLPQTSWTRDTGRRASYSVWSLKHKTALMSPLSRSAANLPPAPVTPPPPNPPPQQSQQLAITVQWEHRLVPGDKCMLQRHNPVRQQCRVRLRRRFLLHARKPHRHLSC